MERTPPISVELWEQILLHVQAVLWEVFDRYEARIARLEAEVAELQAQRNQNSQNSSKPPSSDGPHVKRKPPQSRSGGVPLSIGEVRAPQQGVRRAVQEPVDELRETVQCTDPNVDETPWREQSRRAW